MNVHHRAARILDAVFNHAEENKGLIRTILQKEVEDILLAQDVRKSWESPPIPSREPPTGRAELLKAMADMMNRKVHPPVFVGTDLARDALVYGMGVEKVAAPENLTASEVLERQRLHLWNFAKPR